MRHSDKALLADFGGMKLFRENEQTIIIRKKKETLCLVKRAKYRTQYRTWEVFVESLFLKRGASGSKDTSPTDQVDRRDRPDTKRNWFM